MTHPTLLNDIVFKIVFGTPQNEPLLRALLNALLDFRGQERILELEILNPHINKEYLRERGVILDVKARDGLGQLYNIEVQMWDEGDYVARSLYYLARLFGEQLAPGEPYSALRRTIGISLLDFDLFPNLPELHSVYRFQDAKNGRELTDLLELHYIELSKFKQAKPRRLRTPFEKWLHVLRFGELYQTGLEDVPETLKKEEGIERTLEAMRRAYASDEVRELIELREKARHDWASQLERAEARGEARGRAKGEATGEARGRAKGEATAMETVARKLLASGTPVEAVHELTGMAFEELQRLLEASRG